MQVVLIIGAVQALFFAILLLNKRGKKIPDKILAFWLVILALHLSYIYFLFQKGYTTYLEFSGFDIGIIILYYSVMYIYASSIISNDNVFKIKWLVHIIPTVIIYICMIPYLLLSYEEKLSLFDQNISRSLYLNIAAIAIIIFITYYIIIIFRLLNRHKINIKKTFSYDEKINLTWLRNLSLILGVIWIVYIIALFFVYLNENATNSSSVILYAELELVGYCLFVLFVYLLGFFGYKQGSIFSHRIVYSNFDEHGDDEERVELKVKNLNRTNFSTQKKEEAFVDILNKFMMEQKPYFNSELTLSQLANELNVSTHYLSNILNNYIHKNFYEFINNYRVDEVKKRIISHRNSNFTILAIALDCGFNSKATFNRIFKNYTGNTPSQFQKEYR